MGSVLGAVLFVTCVNDTVAATIHSNYSLFADDGRTSNQVNDH